MGSDGFAVRRFPVPPKGGSPLAVLLWKLTPEGEIAVDEEGNAAPLLKQDYDEGAGVPAAFAADADVASYYDLHD